MAAGEGFELLAQCKMRYQGVSKSEQSQRFPGFAVKCVIML